MLLSTKVCQRNEDAKQSLVKWYHLGKLKESNEVPNGTGLLCSQKSDLNPRNQKISF